MIRDWKVLLKLKCDRFLWLNGLVFPWCLDFSINIGTSFQEFLNNYKISNLRSLKETVIQSNNLFILHIDCWSLFKYFRVGGMVLQLYCIYCRFWKLILSPSKLPPKLALKMTFWGIYSPFWPPGWPQIIITVVFHANEAIKTIKKFGQKIISKLV